MVRKRIIPCLLLQNESLVKTTRFKNPKYIGDVINTVRIFNELEVDELIILDITATPSKSKPNFELLKDIASECFMPLAYGGGINSIDQAKKIIEIGYEKIIINSAAFGNKKLISHIAEELGNQCVIGSIDVKKNILGKHITFSNLGKQKEKQNPFEWARELQELGAGEIMITSINREGTWSGYDLNLIERISKQVDVPVIAHGGARSSQDIEEVFKLNVNAAAIGNMVVYQKKGMGVLINMKHTKK
jgi:imidazole glycerol-phosphate synthase subunit HisF